MAQGRKTGGRQVGTPNRATAAKAAEVEASGLTPLDYMLLVMRDESRDPGDRFDAAKAAAPYVHPRLASLDAKTEETHHFVALLPEPLSIEEWELKAERYRKGEAAFGASAQPSPKFVSDRSFDH